MQIMITAAEPGGGDPMIRERIETAFGCKVRESMGIGDISLSVWAEDDDGHGMRSRRARVRARRAHRSANGQERAVGARGQGELVYTALQREAMPLLRFRSRDHVVVNMQPNPTGAPARALVHRLALTNADRARCESLSDGDSRRACGFRGQVGEVFRIRPIVRASRRQPPLPLFVEMGPGVTEEPAGLRERLVEEIKTRLLVTVDLQLVPYGSLPRDTYKSRLVEHPAA